jgi:signal transduction histidine kinase
MTVQHVPSAAHAQEFGRLAFLDAKGDGLSRPRPINILIIDDSDDDFLIALRTLRLMDTFAATVHHAHDISEARAIVDREQFDVVLVDFCLGLETGAGAIADLGGRIATAVPILLTGMPGQDVPHIALRAGAVHCLDKNRLTPVLLETTIRSALHTHFLEKKLQEAIADLELQNRARSDFFARIGRDLKAPLNAISDYAELIATESFGPLCGEKYLSLAEHIRDDGKRLINVLDALVEDVLKDGAGGYAGQKTIDLRTIVNDAIHAVERGWQTQGYRLELSLPDEPAGVVGQACMLTEALCQLLHDAVERSLPHEKICIAVTKEVDYWVLRIFDNGIGLAPSHNMVASEHNESGLNLVQLPDRSVLSDIVTHHRGILEFKSMPNVGTTVCLSLPVAVLEPIDFAEMEPMSS